MFRKVAVAILFLSMLAACSRGITMDQYIDAMAELGCKSLNEGEEAAAEVMKKMGVSMKQIEEFRKKGRAEDMMKSSVEIAARVMACHGFRMDAGELDQ